MLVASEDPSSHELGMWATMELKLCTHDKLSVIIKDFSTLGEVQKLFIGEPRILGVNRTQGYLIDIKLYSY